MRKDVSPEEKLLRLIRGPKKKAAFRNKGEEIAPPPKEGMFSRTARSISISLPSALKGFNTRALNSILVIILAGLILYFVYDLFYTSHTVKEPDFFLENTNMPEIKAEDILDIKPYSFYSSSIEGRNIFLPQQVESESVITGPTVEEISANLSLIGIIAGDRPQAIIENKKSGKSYFLYKGGSVDSAKVVEILEDSVVMEYQEQKFELVL